MGEPRGEVGQGGRIIPFVREPEGESAAEELIKSLHLCGGQHQGHPDAFPSNKQACYNIIQYTHKHTHTHILYVFVRQVYSLYFQYCFCDNVSM